MSEVKAQRGWVKLALRMEEFGATNVGDLLMSSYYRISSPSQSARQRPGEQLVRETRQRKKPELERSLGRLRAAQKRLPDKRGIAWAEPAGLPVGDDVWPVVDELLKDWVYEA